MPIELRVQLNGQMTMLGVNKLIHKLDEMAAMREMPGIVGKGVVRGIREAFDKSEDPNTGRKWAALKSRAGKPLVKTGKLRRSINYIARGNMVTVSTNFAFAHVHQWGMTIRPRKARMLRFEVFGQTVYAKQVTIPGRPFMPETDAGLRRVTGAPLIKEVEAYFKRLEGKK